MGSDAGKGCSKQALLAGLPRASGDLCVRALSRGDLDTLAGWTSYPPGWEAFNLRFGGMSASERDELFRSRQADPSRITLVADHAGQACVGYLALVEIDWPKRLVGNMGFRVHPAWCDRGIGTRFMRMTAAWCFEEGFQVLRLDVAGAIGRAIRCYEKAGFVRTGEFWREEPRLKGVDLSGPQHDALRPHVRHEGGMPYVRFHWMEARRPE